MGFEVAKAFSARFSTRLDGRAMRLLAAPLLRAFSAMEGFGENTRALEFLRYPLSGEVCLSRRIAARLELPSDWGVETAMMADAFRLCDPRRICQVDIAESHNHRHQSLSSADGLHLMQAGAGVNDRMAGGKADPLLSGRAFQQKISPRVGLGRRQREGEGEIGASAGHPGIVHMASVGLARPHAAEQQAVDAARKRRRPQQRVGFQGRHHLLRQ
jgi:hypothetical protein